MRNEFSPPFWTSAELELLEQLSARLGEGFSHPNEVDTSIDSAGFSALNELATRLTDNDPYFHPRYCGQMLKPPHPVARIAYALAMTLNPNNHALDGGRATAAMEREAVDNLARMFGWTPWIAPSSISGGHCERPTGAGHFDRAVALTGSRAVPWLGHLCGGGTMANFEALWVARESRPGTGIAVSSQAHYTHSRLSAVLQMPCHQVPVDSHARMDLNHLEALLQREQIGTVVVTLGTTGLGAVDPLADIVDLRARYGFRLHVDAAYGGFFKLCEELLPETRRHFAATAQADSLAIDPHKHGLQPYGCGCILFRDPSVAKHYLHDSPYTYYTSDEMHLGEISLECSRAGAAAAALWATQQALPLVPGGQFANGLNQGLQAARQMHAWLATQSEFVPIMQPELDIVAWGIRAETASSASQQARALFKDARREHIYLALVTLPRQLVEGTNIVSHWDQNCIVCLRSVLMKPEHLIWLPVIQSTLRKNLSTV